MIWITFWDEIRGLVSRNAEAPCAKAKRLTEGSEGLVENLIATMSDLSSSPQISDAALSMSSYSSTLCASSYKMSISLSEDAVNRPMFVHQSRGVSYRRCPNTYLQYVRQILASGGLYSRLLLVM